MRFYQMAMDINKRKHDIEELSNFISTSHKRVNDILEILGWSIEKLEVESEEMVYCDFDKEHRVPKSKLKAHLEKCSWRREGYHENDIALPELCGPNSDSISTAVVIDKELQTTVIRDALRNNPSMITGLSSASELDDRLVPKTSDRLLSDFTPDERLALYDYVIAKTGAVSTMKVEDLNMLYKKEDKARPKTKLELLIEQRDAKRRRMSYRHKKVHTNRKSQTEIMREVIKNQMEALEELLNENEDGRETDDEKHSDVKGSKDTDSKHPKMISGNVTDQRIKEEVDIKVEHKSRGTFWKENIEHTQDSKRSSREAGHSWNRYMGRDRHETRRQDDKMSSHSSTSKQSMNRGRSRSRSKERSSQDHRKKYNNRDKRKSDYFCENPYEAVSVQDQREREFAGEVKDSRTSRSRDFDRDKDHSRKSSGSKDLEKNEGHSKRSDKSRNLDREDGHSRRSNRGRDLERDDCSRSSRSESADEDRPTHRRKYERAQFSSDSRNENKNNVEQGYYYEYQDKYHNAAESTSKSVDKAGHLYKRYYEDPRSKHSLEETAHSSRETVYYSTHGDKSKGRSQYSTKIKTEEYLNSKVQRRTSDDRYSRDEDKFNKQNEDSSDRPGAKSNNAVENTSYELYRRSDHREFTERSHQHVNDSESQKSGQHSKRHKSKHKKRKHHKKKRASNDSADMSGYSSKGS